MSASAPRLPLLWRIAQRYLRRELPGWGRVYDLLGGNDEARWRGRGTATVRGKLHGYTMPLDLSNWSERLSFFLGRYHDLPLQLAVQRVLQPGDVFVDVGANLGMLALLACRRVAPGGRVLACEPNPRLARRLESMRASNRLDALEVVPAALGDAPGTAELFEFADHSGWGSLVDVPPEGFAATGRVEVAVRVGDALLADLEPARPLVLKIDVEGYEVPALRGLQQTLARHRPVVFVEVVESHQRRAGHSLQQLRELLERHDLEGYCLACRRDGLSSYRLVLTPFTGRDDEPPDVMFVPRAGALRERLAAILPEAAGSA